MKSGREYAKKTGGSPNMSVDKNSRAARQMNGQASRPASRRSGSGRPVSGSRRFAGSGSYRSSGSARDRMNGSAGSRMSGSAGSRGRKSGRRSGRRYGRKKRWLSWKTAVLTVFLVLMASVGGAVYYVNHLIGKTTNLGVDMEEKTNPNLDIETKKVQKGFWKVAAFGLDSTDGNLGKGANSDVIIIGCLNWETGEVKMASVYRDTYLKVGEKNPYRKINEAYARGGPDQAIEALNENLDIEVDDYVSVNWKVVADVINLLGGVDIEVTDAEFTQINGYITSVVENTGVYSTQLTGPGFQHLDGVQAVAYCRLRKMDTDFRRTERQRAVISQCLEKAKKADLKVLNTIAGLCAYHTSTSIDVQDLIELGLSLGKFHIGETAGFPFDLKIQNVGKLDCVVPDTLSSNVIKLHQFLFGTENYNPSDHVDKISRDIAYNSSKQEDSGEALNESDIERMNSSSGTTRSRDDEREETRESTEERSSRASQDDETDEEGNPIDRERDDESDEYVPDDELINDPGLRTQPEESSSGRNNGTTAARESESTSPRESSSRPGGDGPTQGRDAPEESRRASDEGTSPTRSESSGPGGSTKPGGTTNPGGSTSPGGSSGPGTNPTTSAGQTAPAESSAPVNVGPGGPGDTANRPGGVNVYTSTRPTAEEPTGIEGGPGYVN